MNTEPITARSSRAAFDRASAALDELIILALVPGPLRKATLRAAAAPFGDKAFNNALRRLMQIGEITGEGMTQARIYRLVQVTGIPAGATPAAVSRAVCDDGIEYEPVWPMPSDPRAPPRALFEARR